MKIYIIYIIYYEVYISPFTGMRTNKDNAEANTDVNKMGRTAGIKSLYREDLPSVKICTRRACVMKLYAILILI